MNLLKSDNTFEDSFLTSVMYKLQSLPALLAHAAKPKFGLSNVESFRANHFNEVAQHEGKFIKKVFELAEAIFREYGDHLDEDIEKSLKKEKRFQHSTLDALDLHHVDVLFSILRLKKFMTQPDHD